MTETKFSDVCGLAAEWQRQVARHGAALGKDLRRNLKPLIRELHYMLDHMERRIVEYQKFAADVRSLAERMAKGGVPEVPVAALDNIGQILKAGSCNEAGLAQISEALVAIRNAARKREDSMWAYRRHAIQTYERFAKIKGDRFWIEEGTKGFADEIAKTYKVYMPPEPHASALLRKFIESWAHVEGGLLAEGDPMIVFDDGGRMPMSQVRVGSDRRLYRA